MERGRTSDPLRRHRLRQKNLRRPTSRIHRERRRSVGSLADTRRRSGGVKRLTSSRTRGGGRFVRRGGSLSSPVTSHPSPVTPKKVLYLDFELTETQFNERYSRHENGLCVDKYKFSKRNMRAQISWNQEVPDAFESYGAFMAHSIAEAVDKHKIKVLIVDNISWLATANTHAGAALTLMKALKNLKQDLGISIMVIAHTPKRPYARPMTDNDLAGNKTLANFTDSMIAIGKSHRGHDIRYIKHIKLRNSGSQDDSSNVIVCRLEKPHNFPKFTFLEHGSERAHLMPYYDRAYHYREQLTDEARRLAAEGMTERDIADKLSLGKTTVHRYITEDDRVS
ncbi:MAG: AAA family ATPase [Chloracidobacterium sp.]|nr:AAA family ATPase [Chloracidobacterium sp.]